MIELEHSPLGGSAAHRFMTCAGSFLLHREEIEDGTFENIESEYAKLGAAAHALGALCLTEDTEPFEYIGREIEGYRVGWPDGISLDAVQVYVNECRSIIDGLQGRVHKILIEQTLHLSHLHPLLRGTVDFGAWAPRKGLWLRDYKNGEGVGVSAVNNRQLLYYAALMILSDPEIHKEGLDFPVSLGIVQPNFYGVFEDAEVWDTTAGVVLAWFENELLPKMNALSKTRDIDESDFVLGEHCQFCPVMLDCPKMQGAYQRYVEASEDFVMMLSNDELSALYADREHVQRFMKALENTIYARVVAGGSVPAAKLVEKQTRRVWRPGAEAALAAAFGDHAYDPRTVKSPAAIEKLSTRGKEMALEWGYKPEASGLTIAPLSDRRPEAKPKKGSDVFGAFEQSAVDAGF